MITSQQKYEGEEKTFISDGILILPAKGEEHEGKSELLPYFQNPSFGIYLIITGTGHPGGLIV